MRGPSETCCQPAATAAATSASVKPPSGPMAMIVGSGSFEIELGERRGGRVCDEAAACPATVGRRLLELSRNAVERLGLGDLHEAVAAALFGGFDDGAGEAFDGGCGGLGDAALGDEWDECRDAELG